MTDTHGPYRNVRFLVELDAISIAGFATCRIPERSTDVISYREGTDPPTVRKLAGVTHYGRLVLERGVTESTELDEWYRLVEQGKVDEARRTGRVILLDTEGATAALWEFRNAWPATYRAPRLDATGKGVAIERLEIVCEGVERVEVERDTDGGTTEAEVDSPGDKDPRKGGQKDVRKGR